MSEQPYWPYWLIAIVDGARQAKTIEFMKDRGVFVWCPMGYRWRGSGAKRTKVDAPILPSCYLLIPSPFFDWAAVTGAPGFHRFMSANGVLALIKDEQLEPLREAVETLNNPPKRETAGHRYRRGELVRMIDGIWQGILTSVVSVDNRGSLILDGGRVGRIKTHAAHIEPA